MVEGVDRTVQAADANRIAIIEDIAVTRTGLEVELTRAGYAVRGYATIPDLLQTGAATHVDLVVLDLYLDGEGAPPALDGIARLRAVDLTVVVHSTWALDPDILAALAAGAQAYVQKGATSEPLLRAVARTLTEGAGGDPLLTPEVAAAMRRRDRFQLTAAELEVLTYVGQHLTNQEIAALRVVSEETIKSQVASIRAKLGAADRAGAARAAHGHGLLGRWHRATAAG